MGGKRTLGRKAQRAQCVETLDDELARILTQMAKPPVAKRHTALNVGEISAGLSALTRLKNGWPFGQLRLDPYPRPHLFGFFDRSRFREKLGGFKANEPDSLSSLHCGKWPALKVADILSVDLTAEAPVNEGFGTSERLAVLCGVLSRTAGEQREKKNGRPPFHSVSLSEPI